MATLSPYFTAAKRVAIETGVLTAPRADVIFDTLYNSTPNKPFEDRITDAVNVSLAERGTTDDGSVTRAILRTFHVAAEQPTPSATVVITLTLDPTSAAIRAGWTEQQWVDSLRDTLGTIGTVEVTN